MPRARSGRLPNRTDFRDVTHPSSSRLAGSSTTPAAARTVKPSFFSWELSGFYGTRSSRATTPMLQVHTGRAISFVHQIGLLGVLSVACSAMSKPYERELPAGMAVLGLVIERPGETVKAIAQLLGQRFSYARFADSAAHNALPRYEDQGFVRRVSGGGEQRRSTDRYVATEAGESEFREWLVAVCDGPPTLRDALHGRMEFSEPRHLSFLIEGTKFQLAHCTNAFYESHARLKSFERRARDPKDYRAEIKAALLHDQTVVWGQMMRRLERLAKHLETIQGNCEEAAEEDGG